MKYELLLGCGRGCQIPLVQGAPRMGASKVWGWDGSNNVTPSIDCTYAASTRP